MSQNDRNIRHLLKSSKLSSSQKRSLLRDNLRNNWMYMNGQLSNNLVVKIDSYLIHHISPVDNKFIYDKHMLQNKFHCSRDTVQRALATLNKINNVNVTSHVISFIY